MKTATTVLIFIALPAIFFSSCTTSKTMQRQMRSLQSDLYYELTTPEYEGKITDTVSTLSILLCKWQLQAKDLVVAIYV
jgi:hypothetical protein